MDIWIVRGGWKGCFEHEAIKFRAAIIGWNLGDLSKIKDKAELTKLIRKHFPDYDEGHINTSVKSVWAFIKEIKAGDIILMPLKYPRDEVVIGIASGSYQHVSNAPGTISRPDEMTYNRIPVNWIKRVSKKEFEKVSDKAYWFVLRSQQTVVQIKKDEDKKDILTAINIHLN